MNPDTLTDPRDGSIYRSVQIGAQRWLAENLKYLPAVCSSTTTPDGSPFFYVYDYQGRSVEEAKGTANYRHYGVMYNWYAALRACPPGWHLPSDAEWFALTDFLIHNQRRITAANASFALRSRRQEGSPLGGDCNTSEHPRWDAPPHRNKKGLAALRRRVGQFVNDTRLGFGKDEFGFSALPGGRCSYGGFYRMGVLGYWWSASEASPQRAWCRQMSTGGSVNRWDMGKNYGYSVRCVQD